MAVKPTKGIPHTKNTKLPNLGMTIPAENSESRN